MMLIYRGREEEGYRQEGQRKRRQIDIGEIGGRGGKKDRVV